MGLEVVISARRDSSHLWNCVRRFSGIGESNETLASQISRKICFPCSTLGEGDRVGHKPLPVSPIPLVWSACYLLLGTVQQSCRLPCST